MIRKLVKTGNSVALILSKDMREHLGVDDAVEVQFIDGEIRIRRPMTVEEATEHSLRRYAKAYVSLADASERSDIKFGEAYKRLSE